MKNYKTIVNEKEKYEKITENIRMMKSSGNNRKNSEYGET